MSNLVAAAITVFAAAVAVVSAASAVRDARRSRRFRDDSNAAEWRASMLLARARRRGDTD